MKYCCFIQKTHTMTKSLEQPLSPWERFRSQYLGAVVPRPDKRTRELATPGWANKAKHTLIALALCPFVVPFVPAVAYAVGAAFGFWNAWASVLIPILICLIAIDALLWLIIQYSYGRLPSINILGVAGVCCMGVWRIVDNVYQNLCQKVFNHNYKKYPLWNMIKNTEALHRRRNALQLDTDHSVFELHFCLDRCDNQTIDHVLAWHEHHTYSLQHRHLEVVRAQVLTQFPSFKVYEQKLNEFKHGKKVGKAVWATHELLKMHKLRQSLQNAVALYQGSSHCTRRM